MECPETHFGFEIFQIRQNLLISVAVHNQVTDQPYGPKTEKMNHIAAGDTKKTTLILCCFAKIDTQHPVDVLVVCIA